MEVRRLARTDLEPLLALYAHLHADDTPVPPRAEVEAVWDELLGNDRYLYWGLFSEGQLASSCTLTVIPNLTRSCRPYGVIENVVTDARYRRRGYGKALLAHALSQAWRAGCYKVMLMTGRKDEATFRFYESAGFSRGEKQAFLAKPPA